MVTAGVYLIARSAALFALSPVASLTVAVVGAATALLAATIGLKQWDIKKVLAYSTVSQLGYMFVAVGVGAYVAGHVPSRHARLLQGAAVSRLRVR
jgi:NADH-quinone oxidoreductase subunit L